LKLKVTIQSFFKQLLVTCTRFPLSICCAILACALIIFVNHLHITPESILLENKVIRIAIESIAGISLFYSFHIYSENQDLDWAKRLGFILLGFCLLGLHYFSIPNDVYNFGINYTLRYIIIVFCFHLIVSFSLYNQQSETEAFWQYNEFLFVRFITTLLFSLILFAGIAGGIWAIDVLFGIDIHEDYYFDVLAFMLLIFQTFFFFNTVPLDTHYFEREKNYQNALRIFVQYILIPIVILYGVILSVYLGKILLTHVLPKGWVAVPILIFSGLGILTYLLAYPIRNAKQDIIHLFCKYFFYVMLPFLTLYFSSLVKRISNYGFTEERYMAFLLGIWLVFISIYVIVSKVDNIIFMPVSLCILLALSSFGPWGMYRYSGASQYNRLTNILKENNLIKNNKLNAKTNFKLNAADGKQVNSIISYLYSHNEINHLKNILSEAESKKLDQIIKEGFDERNVGDLLGVSGKKFLKQNEEKIKFSCYSNDLGLRNLPLQINGYKNILQFAAIDNDEANNDFVVLDSNAYYPILLNNSLCIVFKNDTILHQNLKEYALTMRKNFLESIGDSTFFDKTMSKITIPYRQQYFAKNVLMFDGDKAKFYIEEMQCQETRLETKVISLSGYAIF
jgi:Domain of unknown function (DUF4153)